MSDFEKIDRGGELMTIEEWQDCVEDGVFIDNDGFGYFADVDTDTMYNAFEVYPSDYIEKSFLYEEGVKEWTHIVWFNR